MKLPPRARFIILEDKAPIRDCETAQRIYDEKFKAFPNAKYAGFISHKFDGPRPAHNYLFENASTTQIEALNDLIDSGAVNGKIQLERYS